MLFSVIQKTAQWSARTHLPGSAMTRTPQPGGKCVSSAVLIVAAVV
jgi:hypothetical protein